VRGRGGLALLVAVALGGGLAACGGGGSSTPSTTATPSAPAAAAKKAPAAVTAAKAPATGRGAKASPSPPADPAYAHARAKAGAGAGFVVRQGDNSIPTYGAEASGSESAAAEAALSGYLAARAGGDWASACALMSASLEKQIALLAGEAGAGKSSCAAAYAKLSEHVPAAERADPLTQGLTALRVESPHAFALFYGPQRQQYMMPMTSEGGAWKVSQIAAIPYPVGAPAAGG
jgi:hypothetical protein